MSKEDIENAVREAEQFAAEDKKNREQADIRNTGDQLVYQTEQAMTDLGDKLPADDKAQLQQKLDALKEALKGTDYELIKTGVDSLQKTFMDISQKLYQAQGGAQGAPGADMGAQGAAGDDFVDADFKDAD